MQIKKLSELEITFVDESNVHQQIAMTKPEHEGEIISLVKYEGTELYQWVCQMASGDFLEVGEPFLLDGVMTIKDLTGDE